jgi:acyl CoA:acetate/3-ketoacid CoA transferase alpha subunit
MSDISEIERDVEQARDNLNRTLDAIHHKAAATSELLLHEQEIRRYPVSSLCGALALGLAAGGARIPALLIGVMAIGSLIVAGSGSTTERYAGGLSHGVC